MSRSKIWSRSIVDSFCSFKFPHYRHKTFRVRFQCFSSSIGSYCNEERGESVIRSLQLKIVNALALGDRVKASDLLFDLGHGSYRLKADHFVSILDYCAKSPDPLFVMETWRIMMEKEINLNYKCCLLCIRALCKGGYLEELSSKLLSRALQLMKFLREDHNTFSILPMYNSFLSACAQTQSFNYAEQCLDLMEFQVIGKNDITYWVLLKLAVWQQNLFAVHEIWEEYVKYYNLSVITLQHFIRSFTRLRDLKSAYATLQHMVALAFQKSLFISNIDDSKLYSSRLDIPIPSTDELCLNWEDKSNVNILPSITENLNQMGMQESNTKQCTTLKMGIRNFRIVGTDRLDRLKSLPFWKILTWSFNDVIRACAIAKNYELAEQLMLQMQNLGLTPSSHTYDCFIAPLVSKKGFHDGMEVLKLMQERNLKPYDSTFATVSVECSKVLELDLAEILLDQIAESKNAYAFNAFNAFLAACDAQDQPERAVRMLAKMKQMGLHPNIRTYELLFSLFGNLNAPYEDRNMMSQVDAAKRINAIEMDMLKNGIPHSHFSMMNLMKALGREGMIKELIHYLYVAEDQLCRSNANHGTLIYNIVLHSLVEAKESHWAVETFKRMKTIGLLPDAATYNVMVDCCSIIRCYKSASALVSVMVRAGFSPQTVTFTSLVKILLESEDFEEALNLLDKASAEGIATDVVLYNTFLQKACLKEKIDVMEFIVERMHREKIQPDPSTCGYVFSAYVDLGFENTGMEALQVLSMRMISEDESILQENKQEYEEDFIFCEDPDAESRILQYFRNSDENLAVALLNLRWCASLGFPISWLPNHTAWASRLERSYGSRNEVGL